MSKMEELIFTETQRGNIKLGYKGYLYDKNSTNDTAIRYRCELFHSKKCPGRMYTNLAMDEVVCGGKAVGHSHLPSHKNVELVKFRQTIKSTARETDKSNAQIINAALSQLSKEAFAVAPSEEAMQCLIQRQRGRYKKSEMREEPQSLFDWDPSIQHNKVPKRKLYRVNQKRGKNSPKTSDDDNDEDNLEEFKEELGFDESDAESKTGEEGDLTETAFSTQNDLLTNMDFEVEDL